LPIPDDAATVNVAAQRADPASMLAYVRGLVWRRKRSAALRWGSYRPLDGGPAGVFAYLREAGDERLLVALNFTAATLSVDAGAASVAGHAPALPAAGTVVLATDPKREGEPVALRPLVLGPDEGLVVDLAGDPSPA